QQAAAEREAQLAGGEVVSLQRPDRAARADVEQARAGEGDALRATARRGTAVGARGGGGGDEHEAEKRQRRDTGHVRVTPPPRVEVPPTRGGGRLLPRRRRRSRAAARRIG